MSNRRIFYAIQQCGLAPLGTTTFGSSHVIHGCQSVGMNTKFNLEQAFELGQVAIYQNIEGIPDVEITLEKVLDGDALIYHLATSDAAGPSLLARADEKSQFAMSIFSDQQEAASGSALTTVFCSGVFLSSVGYNFTVEGNHSEQVTLVGNNKQWGAAGITFAGFMNNLDTPTSAVGIARRQHILWVPAASGGKYTVLPNDVEGISSSGTNNTGADGQLGAHVQSIKASANLGRENMFELGRKGNYHRYTNFPVEVKTDIEVIGVTGDTVDALEEVDNLTEQTIRVKSREGIYLDLGTKNKLQSVSYGGGNAGNRGGNVSETYSYVTYNDFTVLHPADPAGFTGY